MQEGGVEFDAESDKTLLRNKSYALPAFLKRQDLVIDS